MIVVSEVNSNDVLLGRGTGPNDHPGNVAFRRLIQAFRVEYEQALLRGDKAKVALKVVLLVHAHHGRFLRKIHHGQANSSTRPSGENKSFFDKNDVSSDAAAYSSTTVNDGQYESAQNHFGQQEQFGQRWDHHPPQPSPPNVPGSFEVIQDEKVLALKTKQAFQHYIRTVNRGDSKQRVPESTKSPGAVNFETPASDRNQQHTSVSATLEAAEIDPSTVAALSQPAPQADAAAAANSTFAIALGNASRTFPAGTTAASPSREPAGQATANPFQQSSLLLRDAMLLATSVTTESAPQQNTSSLDEDLARRSRLEQLVRLQEVSEQTARDRARYLERLRVADQALKDALLIQVLNERRRQQEDLVAADRLLRLEAATRRPNELARIRGIDQINAASLLTTPSSPSESLLAQLQLNRQQLYLQALQSQPQRDLGRLLPRQLQASALSTLNGSALPEMQLENPSHSPPQPVKSYDGINASNVSRPAPSPPSVLPTVPLSSSSTSTEAVVAPIPSSVLSSFLAIRGADAENAVRRVP